MRRRDFITILGSASATLPFGAVAQEPGRIYRLGNLTTFPRDRPFSKLFTDKLRGFGFIEGQNLAVEWRTSALLQRVAVLIDLLNVRTDRMRQRNSPSASS
jgi:hypothetical protein